MSCTGSWSTDSGVRNPSTTPTLVAPGPGGGAGGVSDVGCTTGAAGIVSAVGVSDCGGDRRSTGGHAAPRTATAMQRTVPLMDHRDEAPGRQRPVGLRKHVHHISRPPLEPGAVPRQRDEPELPMGRTEVPGEVRRVHVLLPVGA